MSKPKTPPNPTRLKLARSLYGPSHPKGPTVGPDVVSVKRATARAFPDIYSWANFDQVYNGRLEKAWRRIQAIARILPHSGQYGTLSHDFLRHRRRDGHPGEWAFDATAINLMQAKWEAVHEPPAPPEERVREAMGDFMRKALTAASLWHYSWTRPMLALGRDPLLKQYSDCSTGATEVYFWPRMVTGVLVPDPNGRGFDGWGNTDTLWAANSSRQVSGTFEVGDLALYTEHQGHVTVCMEPGGESSSAWWSNGSERAPNECSLHYRSDLRGVVRPRLVS